jgi:hypothetical protein
MKGRDLSMLSSEELWALHEKIGAILSTKLDAEKHDLERRLALLNGRAEPNGDRERRPYPKVLPKYQNPDQPFETWSGWQATALGRCTNKEGDKDRGPANVSDTLKRDSSHIVGEGSRRLVKRSDRHYGREQKHHDPDS